MTSNEHFNSIDSFTSDEEKLETPFRLIRRQKSVTTVYSDHCLISASFNIPHEIRKVSAEKRWIITQDGLQKFFELTTPPFYKVDETVGIDLNYNKCTNKLHEIMGKCFKQKQIKSHELDLPNNNALNKVIKQLRKLRKKGKVQRKVADTYIVKIKELQARKVNQQNIEKLREAYIKLGDDGKFSANLFWKLSKSICRKQADNKSSIMVNETTELFGEIAIINAYKEEFSYRLRNRKIEDGLEEFQSSLELLVSLYLEHAETVRSQDNFTLEELIEIITALQKKKSPGLDGITTDLLKSAGLGLLEALLDIFNYMKNNVVVPHQWEQVVITTIYKGKGKKERTN